MDKKIPKAKGLKKARRLYPWTKVPLTKRWCFSCKDFRWYEFNPNIGHSECTSCGSRMASKDKPKEEKC